MNQEAVATEKSGLVSGAELMADVDLSQIELAAEPAVGEPLAMTVAPAAEQPITGTYLETYHVYGTKAQCGFELMLVRMRDIDAKRVMAPVLRVFPKYKLQCETNRDDEIVIRHMRRKGLFRFENVPDLKEFVVSRKKAVCRKTLLWKDVTPEYKDLWKQRPEAWERLFQDLFSKFDEMWECRKAQS